MAAARAAGATASAAVEDSNSRASFRIISHEFSSQLSEAAIWTSVKKSAVKKTQAIEAGGRA
jgi:hypothetical protein